MIKKIATLTTLFMMLGALSTITYAEENTQNIYGWLHTEGNQIKDEDGNVVRLMGVNWFGMEGTGNAPHGLWTRNWEDMLDQMATLGYNTIRLPFANETLDQGELPEAISRDLNPDIFPDGENPMDPIDLMDLIIEGAGQRGMMVILDNHLSLSGVTTNNNGLWYEGHISHERWIEDWIMLAERYKDNPTVVGMDLHNEPHSACWGCDDPALDWRGAAEEAGNAILEVNPNVLIVVEGVWCYDPADGSNSGCPHDHSGWCQKCTWWGGNLQGVKDRPIEYDVPNQLVYSPHEYTHSVYPQVWFDDPNYPNNLDEIWEYNWGFIHTEEIAPLLFGEFGTPDTEPSSIDGIWYRYFVDYIAETQSNFTYWSWNPNSGDTGGLLQTDWESEETEKIEILADAVFPFEPLPLPQIACDVTVEYGNTWEGGFDGSVILHNVGEVNIRGWEVTWTIPDGVTYNQMPEAEYEITGDQVRAYPPTHSSKKIIGTGQSVSFGLAGLGSTDIPTDFAINRIPCDGSAAPPIVTLTLAPTDEPEPTATQGSVAPPIVTLTPTPDSGSSGDGVPLAVTGTQNATSAPAVLLLTVALFTGFGATAVILSHKN